MTQIYFTLIFFDHLFDIGDTNAAKTFANFYTFIDVVDKFDLSVVRIADANIKVCFFLLDLEGDITCIFLVLSLIHI